MNYTELSAQIDAYVQGAFDSTEIDTFIRQAEQRIYNTVQLAYLRKNVDGQLSQGNKYLSAPVDFLAVYSIAVINNAGEYYYLQNRDVNFIRETYPNPSTTGFPKYYAIFGPTVASSIMTNELSFIIGPTPNNGYDVELHYYFYPESIVDAGTTWLGDNFDSVLLYGCLVEAYTYLKGEQDLLALYDGKYKEALALLRNLGEGKQRGDAYQDGQVKIPVS
jgi:hypothetical protein